MFGKAKAAKNQPQVRSKVVVSKFGQRPAWMLIIPAALILVGAGAAGVWFVMNQNKSTPKKTVSQSNTPPEQVAKQLIAASDKEQQAAAQRPTDSQQLATLVHDLSNPNLSSGDQFQDYSDAALLAAGLNKPEAKTYAKKALALFPSDAADPRSNTRAAEQGLIDKLTAISKGDYSVVPK